jgi:uncharacterized protein (TIGR03435 family)
MRRAPALLLAAILIGPMFDDGGLRAQTPPAPRFEVVSLKERERNIPLGLVGMQATPGRLINRCATLTSLVYYAFRITSTTPIEDLPGWASTPCSDDETANTYEFQATMPVETSDADVRRMLQGFLVERFKLAFHRETRTRPIYALVAGSGGIKVKPTDPKDDPPFARGSIGCPPDDRGCRIIPMGSVLMPQIADALAFHVGRPVVDKTGLAGTYYFFVKYAGEATPNSSLPSLPTALKEQFGLELKSDTGPVEVLVIDRAEKPTPN